MSNLRRLRPLEHFLDPSPRRALARAAADFPTSAVDENANWIAELPQPLRRQMELESRMPEADFVPETVVDPHLRRILKHDIERREERKIRARRSEQQWGNQVPGISPGQSSTILQWNSQADHPEAININLAYTFDNSETSPTDDVNLYAKIEWGGGGAQQTAIVDFQQGTQIRVTASYIRISALYLPTNLPTPWPPQPIQNSGFMDAGVTGATLTAGAILGIGFPTFRTSAARFTRKFQLQPLTALLFDPIPPFASGFGLALMNNGLPGSITPSLANAPVDLTFRTTSQATSLLAPSTYGFGVTAPTPFGDNEYLLPQGSRFMSVQNLDPVNVANIGIVYALML